MRMSALFNTINIDFLIVKNDGKLKKYANARLFIEQVLLLAHAEQNFETR